MLFRILEFCLTAIFLVITIKEVILPLMRDQPLFPMIRKTINDKKNGL